LRKLALKSALKFNTVKYLQQSSISINTAVLE